MSQTRNIRRWLGVAGAVAAVQMLSACVVLPVPAHPQRTVVVQPGYAKPAPPPAYHHRDRERHRNWRR